MILPHRRSSGDAAFARESLRVRCGGAWLALVLSLTGGCTPSLPDYETVELHQKNLATGLEVERGASATLRYRPSGPRFDFVCDARRLPRAENYMLIYLPDPWPGQGWIRIAQGSTDGGGNLHLEGKVDTGSLPAATDAGRAAGARLWLVPPSLIGPEGLQDAETDRCLVERRRIHYTRTEAEGP